MHAHGAAPGALWSSWSPARSGTHIADGPTFCRSNHGGSLCVAHFEAVRSYVSQRRAATCCGALLRWQVPLYDVGFGSSASRLGPAPGLHQANVHTHMHHAIA
jgi:hypothetical protein